MEVKKMQTETSGMKKHRRLEICVDLDGIAADFFKDLLQQYNALTGESSSVEDIVSWEMGDCVKYPSVLREVFHTPGFFRNLSPVAGAVEALREMVNMGHTVHIVSSGCTPHSYTEKALWCAEHLPFIGLSHVSISHRKGQLHGDVMIDDGPHNARAFRHKNPKSLILGIEWPHAKQDRNVFDFLADYRDPHAAWGAILDAVNTWSAM